MTASQPLAPGLLGFWTRCIRDTLHWSQEALAEASGLTCRTIQRIEAGGKTSVTTRRSLARGLGYSDPNIFDDPEFVSTVEDLIKTKSMESIEDLKQQFPEHRPIPVEKVRNGDTLIQLAEMSNAYLFHCDESLPIALREQAATMFDYLRDLGDIAPEISFSEKVDYGREIDGMVQQIRSQGAEAYWAAKDQKIVGENWADKTPFSIRTGYLAVIDGQKDIKHLMVPKKLS